LLGPRVRTRVRPWGWPALVERDVAVVEPLLVLPFLTETLFSSQAAWGAYGRGRQWRGFGEQARTGLLLPGRHDGKKDEEPQRVNHWPSAHGTCLLFLSQKREDSYSAR